MYRQSHESKDQCQRQNQDSLYFYARFPVVSKRFAGFRLADRQVSWQLRQQCWSACAVWRQTSHWLHEYLFPSMTNDWIGILATYSSPLIVSGFYSVLCNSCDLVAARNSSKPSAWTCVG